MNTDDGLPSDAEVIRYLRARIATLEADLAEAVAALTELRKHAISSGYDEDAYGDALLRARDIVAKHKPAP